MGVSQQRTEGGTNEAYKKSTIGQEVIWDIGLSSNTWRLFQEDVAFLRIVDLLPFGC
jgi:hypothetical protein